MPQDKYLLKAVANSNLTKGMLKSGDADQLLGTCLAAIKSWAQPSTTQKTRSVAHPGNPSPQRVKAEELDGQGHPPRHIQLETRYMIPCLKEKKKNERNKDKEGGEKGGRKDRH